MNKQEVQQFAKKVVEIQDCIDGLYLQLQYLEKLPAIANEGISICQMRSYLEYRLSDGRHAGIHIFRGFDTLAKALCKENEVVHDEHIKSFTYRGVEFYSLEDQYEL